MMENKIWYALQRNTDDDWSEGTYDRETAMKLLEGCDKYQLIAVIENDVCIEEIWK